MIQAAHARSECSCRAEAEAVAPVRDEPASQGPADLIAFVLERYHATHRRELPELQHLARKVEAVHADREACQHGLHHLLMRMGIELDAHMQKEEQVLFPLLLASGGGCTPFAIQRMRIEHEDHEELLSALRTLTDGFRPPDDACGSWRRLYSGCEKLYADVEAHIALENTVLFPQFE